MANKRLIDAYALAEGKDYCEVACRACWVDDMILEIDPAPTVEAVEVVRIKEVKKEILQTLDVLIETHRDISNSQFSNYEKHLDIPKSSNDYYGIYADTMEIARRLVNAALTDLCENCGAKIGGDGNGDL